MVQVYKGGTTISFMSKDKHIPQGYKDSSLGIIPKEWEVKRLGELCTKIGSGVTPRGGQNVYLSQGRPFLRSQNVANGYLLLDDVVFIDEITHQKQKSTEIELDDVLLNITGASIGRSAVATSEIVGGNVNQHVCIIRLKDKTLSYYICAFLLSYIGQKQIDSYQAGGNREGLNYDQIASFKIFIPSSKEIIQIWNFLSLWDTAIEKQSELIEKLKLRKRALMQQLLTGKKRLPGFSGEWKRIKLGDIAERITRKNEEDNKNVVTISAQRGFVVQTDFFNKSVASETLDNYYLVHKDEFCYNKSYSNGYPMGAIKRLTAFDKAVVTTLYICFRLKESSNINIDFFEQYCESGIFNKELVKVANEGGRAHGLLNVTPSDFFNMHMKIPSIEEQNAIATVLFNADKEIELANKKLNNLQSQKRGLMQQLLTGKIRTTNFE